VNLTAIARVSGLLWLALASGACGDPLVSIERIASLRALGARVEVEGEPDRAAPLPGESAHVEFLVAAPELAPNFGFGLVVCEASPGEAGTPTCAGEPFASVYTEPASEAPSLDFTVPAELAADARVAVLGVLCEGEAPRSGSTPPLCESEGPEHRLSLGFSLPGEYEPNRNPNFSEESITLDGEPLLALEPVDGACSGLGFTEVARGSGHTFALTLAEDAREALPETDGVGPALEGLQLSHFATDGELDRAFSYVGAEQAELSANVGWKAPGNPAEGGTLVRFFFVVRDFRGGSAFTERALCVLP
jgi:hypothetical protein